MKFATTKLTAILILLSAPVLVDAVPLSEARLQGDEVIDTQIEGRIKQIRAQIEESASDYDREK